MNKRLLVCLLLVLCINLVACGKETPAPVPTEAPTPTEEPKETVEITKDNFLDYFKLTIQIGPKSVDGSKKDLIGFTTYSLSWDMNITIKALFPLECKNAYITFKPNLWSDVYDDKVTDLKLDSDGYYTGSKKIHCDSKILNLSLYYLEDHLDIIEASGTISYNPNDKPTE